MVAEAQVKEVAALAPEDSNAIIEEMLKAKPAPEPGDFMLDRVISSDLPGTGMVTDTLVSAGHVNVWDTQTGDKSIINRNMLSFQMMKKHSDGTRAFTLTDPGITPPRGTLRCMLHADSPDRAKFDRYGFRKCPKANLMTEFDVEQHMKARHKKEWASIQSDRTRSEKEEDRALQRQTLQAMTRVITASHPQPEKKSRNKKAKTAA